MKVFLLEKELKHHFTGKIGNFEKINGEIQFSIIKTEFDPFNEIEYYLGADQKITKLIEQNRLKNYEHEI